MNFSGVDRQDSKNNEWLNALREQSAQTTTAYDELRKIRAQEDIDKFTRMQDADDSFAYAVADTPENGRLSDAQVKYLNRRRGIDTGTGGVQNGQLMEAGYNPRSGGYGFVFANVDKDGNVNYKPMEISRNDLYGMMSSRPELFTPEQVAKVGAAIKSADPSYTDDGLKVFGSRYQQQRKELFDKIDDAKSRLRGYGNNQKGLSLEDRKELQSQKHDFTMKEIGARGQNSIDLAKLTGEQKRQLADAANLLKKYGIDIGLEIAKLREDGRQTRANMRDDQVWGKLALEQQKIDNNFAVQMQRADTYGKRVALIEQKLKNDYEVAMKRATTDEERQKVDAEYKDRMASVSEGNLDLGWFKAETSADQNQQKIDNEKVYRDRLLALKARKIALEKEGKQLSKSELDEMLKLQKVLEGSGLEPETRQLVHDQLNDIMEPKPSATSGGDNVDYDKSQSTEYPRYTNGKAKRAIAAGWTWNAETKRFEPPKGK